MIEDLAGCVIIAVLAVIVLRGAFSIATGGFLSLVFGGLVLAFVLQTIVSACSTALLGLITNSLPDPSRAAFLRGVLAALAQPTVSGIAILATILVLSFAVNKVAGLTEEIAILLETHKSVLGKAADADRDGHKKE